MVCISLWGLGFACHYRDSWAPIRRRTLPREVPVTTIHTEP